MSTAIITIAGISSRFNEGIAEEDKKLKAVYYEKDSRQTLLYHLLLKCSFADRIVLVGGYRYDSLLEYIETLPDDMKAKISTVYNEHYSDLGSGYSLYLGIDLALKDETSDILFVEGDLDIDNESFKKVSGADTTVLTYTYEPIYANKAVVLYIDGKGDYRYAFNSSHGLLTLDEPFSAILNSGQLWRFNDMEKLGRANKEFYDKDKGGTNLSIIQKYLDQGTDAQIVGLKRWTNCNTREDFRKIAGYWEEENENA